LIEKILPDAVASTEAWDDPPDAVLYPGEAEPISRAVDKRRRKSQLAAAGQTTSWDRLLFCAKESVYRAWFR
jgi:4'-phosphopantetheinyl transferase EntD